MQPTGGEIPVVNFLTTLGVGGALAAFMFILYRRDIKSYTDLWKNTAEQLIGIVKENTESNVELKTLIETKLNERREDKETIEQLRRRIEHLERRRGAQT